MASESKSSLIFMRVDHVGSLLRPARLQEAIVRHKEKPAGEEEIEKAQEEAIREVIAKQEAHGLPVVNDGESPFRIALSARLAALYSAALLHPGRGLRSQALREKAQLHSHAGPSRIVSHWPKINLYRSIYLRKA